MDMEVVALIGVRGGSKRVANKNSRPFCGSNLLTLKIATLQRVPGIARVMVNSECDELLRIARSCGAETTKRDAKFASDQISASDYYQNSAENCDADVILSASVTTPLFSVESYQKGIEAFYQTDYARHDSVTSCCRVKEFLYQDGVPINYDPAMQVRSQDLPEIFSVNYGFSIIRRCDMIKYRNIVGRRPLLVETPRLESIDIDTEEDFFIASTLYSALNHQMREAA